MNCEDCGAELTKGTYYCGGCGRPVGLQALGIATAEPEPGLDEVPEPAASMEASPSLEPSFRTKVQGKGLCGICMGAFPETVLSIIDGKPFCPDCTPLASRRRDPEVRENESVPEPMEHRDVVSGPLLLHDNRSGAGMKGLLAILALVLVAGVGAATFVFADTDRIDDLMSGLDTGRKDAYLLAQSYVPGESHHYEIRCSASAAGEVQGMMFPKAGAFDGKVQMTGGVSLEVLKVDSENNADVAMTTRDFDLDLDFQVDGERLPLPPMGPDPLEGLKGQTVVMKVDAFGNPTAGQGPEGMSELLSSGFGEIPQKHLRVGDTWSARVPLDNTNGLQGAPVSLSGAAFVVNYRVEGFKQFRDRDCMAISMKGELVGLDDISAPGMGDAKFNMDAKGVMFYDVGLGRMVKVALDVAMDVGVASPMMGIELDIEFEVDMDLR